MNSRGAILLGLCFAFLPGSRIAEAEEFSFLYGRAASSHGSDTSRGWQIEYRHGAWRRLDLSASYVNEGHLESHNRDGAAVQVWGLLPLYEGRIVLSAGAGPYLFFDTGIRTDGSFDIDHGLGGILSASAAYRTDSPVVFRFTANRVAGTGENDSWSFLLGAGYALRGERESSTGGGTEAPGNAVPPKTGTELAVFAGETFVNNPQNQTAVAAGVEFRKGAAPHLDWTLAYLDEGNPEVLRRYGLAAQLWLVDTYAGGRLGVGAGGGGYLFIDTKREREKEGSPDLGYLLSLTACWRFEGRWIARAAWSRVIVDYDRDSDVFLLGAGYRLKE